MTNPLTRLFIIAAIIGALPNGVRGQARQDSVPVYLSLKVFAVEEEIHVFGYNSNYGPLSAYAQLEENDSLVLERVIPPRDSLLFFNIEVANRDKISIADSLNKLLNFGYFLGDQNTVKPDSNYLYRLPFKKGKTYRINQGANGKFSHNHPVSRYAIDFGLKIGDPVYAARGGLIVSAIDWFTRNGGRELIDFANRVVILHDDGTIASYVHLAPNGVLVREGDHVTRGQVIARSGNTGFTRGPHLHFVVRKEKDISIPIRFEGYENTILETGNKVHRRK